MPAFRIYMLPSARNANRIIGMKLEDIDGIENITTVDLDGRGLNVKPAAKGIHIHRGQKVVII